MTSNQDINDALVYGLLTDESTQTSSYVNKFIENRPVCLADEDDIDWTGLTDSTEAVQRAIDEAGAGRAVELGRGGVLRLNQIELLEQQTLRGVTHFVGTPTQTQSTELKFPSETPGNRITTRTGSSLENLLIRGPGAHHANIFGVRNGASASAHFFRNCQFVDWNTAVRSDSVYYSTYHECEWRRNNTALVIAGGYNTQLFRPRIDAKLTNPQGQTKFNCGIQLNNIARPLTIFGGSIEGFGHGSEGTYQPGIWVNGSPESNNAVAVNLFGVYFENFSNPLHNSTPVYIRNRQNTAVTAIGCTAFLSCCDSFIKSEAEAPGTLTALGTQVHYTDSKGRDRETIPDPICFDFKDHPYYRALIKTTSWAVTLPAFHHTLDGIRGHWDIDLPGAYKGTGSTWINRSPVVRSGETAPTEGFWVRGDVVNNTLATPEAPSGWICTRSGYPEDWAALSTV